MRRKRCGVEDVQPVQCKLCCASYVARVMRRKLCGVHSAYQAPTSAFEATRAATWHNLGGHAKRTGRQRAPKGGAPPPPPPPPPPPSPPRNDDVENPHQT
eukprot:3964744-Pyramimonas_sp.AAC.1